MKLCKDCNTEKPETEFYRDTSRSDGLNWRCKPCHRAHVAEVSMRPPKNPGPAGSKRCQHCKEVKPLDQYSHDKTQHDGHARQCKACAYTRHKEWVSRHPGYSAEKHRRGREKAPERYADYSRKRNHGLNPGDYGRMLAAQGGGCAICGTTDPGNGKSFHVDHCHVHGNIRGLLCQGCNTGLGQFRDNATTLRQAADYLDKSAKGASV